MTTASRSLLVLALGLLSSSCAQGTDTQADTFLRPRPDAGTGAAGGASGSGGSGGTGISNAVCGNGVVEDHEPCDQGDLNGRTCESEGFASGDLQCTADCLLDTSNCSACGNGIAEPSEECDGADLGAHDTCADLQAGSASEALSCTPQCTYDLSLCSGCGNGLISPPEDCEPASSTTKVDLGGTTCEDLGWHGGQLDCNPSCRFDESGCYVCGDASKNGVEQCDGADFGGKVCGDFTSITGEPFASGSLTCSPDCKVDTSNCMRCGDGVVSGNEVCDEGVLGGETCQTQGFTGGTLGCSLGCSGYNTAACTLCGDGTVEGSEQCDGQNLSGATCQTLGFGAGGSLSCSSSCTFNTSACSNNTCGDGTINGTDQCDCGSSSSCTSAQLGGKTCASFTSPAGSAYAGGALDCLSPNNCSFDLAGCYYCGDGKIDPGEACDGAALGNQTCIGLGFVSGNLSCGANCQFNTSGCVSVPNPILECSAPNLVLLDNDPTGKSDTITISAAKQIVDVDVMLIVPHGWPGDVLVKLTHGSTTRTLIDQPGVPASTYGCSENDIDCTLDDEGTGPVENTCGSTVPAISGTLTPNESLSAFDGQGTSGAWTLQVADVESAITGTFAEWCVVLYWQ